MHRPLRTDNSATVSPGALLVILCAILAFPWLLQASAPQWWIDSGVIKIDPGTGLPVPAQDFAALNQGQLLNLAASAYDELYDFLDFDSSDGAGQFAGDTAQGNGVAAFIGSGGDGNFPHRLRVDYDNAPSFHTGTPPSLTSSLTQWGLTFSAPTAGPFGKEYAFRVDRPSGVRTVSSGVKHNAATAVNVGQLKNAAVPFYDWFIRRGFITAYPWTSTLTASNFAPANIGQAKNLFKFGGVNQFRGPIVEALKPCLRVGGVSKDIIGIANSGSYYFLHSDLKIPLEAVVHARPGRSVTKVLFYQYYRDPAGSIRVQDASFIGFGVRNSDDADHWRLGTGVPAEASDWHPYDTVTNITPVNLGTPTTATFGNLISNASSSIEASVFVVAIDDIGASTISNEVDFNFYKNRISYAVQLFHGGIVPGAPSNASERNYARCLLRLNAACGSELANVSPSRIKVTIWVPTGTPLVVKAEEYSGVLQTDPPANASGISLKDFDLFSRTITNQGGKDFYEGIFTPMPGDTSPVIRVWETGATPGNIVINAAAEGTPGIYTAGGNDVVINFTAASYSGTSYVVAQSGPANFTRIQQALDVIKPGDTVTIKPGRYREWLRLQKGGTPGRRVTIASDGAGVIIDGTIPVKNGALVSRTGDASFASGTTNCPLEPWVAVTDGGSAIPDVWRAKIVPAGGSAPGRTNPKQSSSPPAGWLRALDWPQEVYVTDGTTSFPLTLVGYPSDSVAAADAALRSSIGGPWFRPVNGTTTNDASLNLTYLKNNAGTYFQATEGSDTYLYVHLPSAYASGDMTNLIFDIAVNHSPAFTGSTGVGQWGSIFFYGDDAGYVDFNGLHFVHSNTLTTVDGGGAVSMPPVSTMTNCSFEDLDGRGLGASIGSLIDTCNIERAGFVGMFGSWGVTVRNCLFKGNYTRQFYGHGEGSANKWIGDLYGTIEGCTYEENHIGLWFDFCRSFAPRIIRNNIFLHNTAKIDPAGEVHDGLATGLVFEGAMNALVENNYFVSNEGVACDMSSAQLINFRNNTIYCGNQRYGNAHYPLTYDKTAMPGINSYNANNLAPTRALNWFQATHNQIVNNLFIGTGRDASDGHFFTTNTGASNGRPIWNAVNCVGRVRLDLGSGAAESIRNRIMDTGSMCDYNCYYTGRVVSTTTPSILTLASMPNGILWWHNSSTDAGHEMWGYKEWQRGNGFDLHSVFEQDPLFLATPTSLKEQFQLTTGSPCINKASPSAPTTDFYGTSRPSGMADIGAFEVP